MHKGIQRFRKDFDIFIENVVSRPPLDASLNSIPKPFCARLDSKFAKVLLQSLKYEESLKLLPTELKMVKKRFS